MFARINAHENFANPQLPKVALIGDVSRHVSLSIINKCQPLPISKYKDFQMTIIIVAYSQEGSPV